MSTSPTACVCGWEVLALPAFSLPLPTGIRLLGSKILLAIFKVLSEPTQLLLPLTDPAVRIFSCFLLPLLQAWVATAGIPSSFSPGARSRPGTRIFLWRVWGNLVPTLLYLPG